MAKNWNFYSKTIIHVPDTSVFITLCLNDFFPSTRVTKLTSYTVSLLIDVAFYSLGEFNKLLTFQRFLSMFVCQICHRRTH